MSEKENPTAVKKEEETEATGVHFGIIFGAILAVVAILIGTIDYLHDNRETYPTGYTNLESVLKNDRYAPAHQLIIDAMDDGIVTQGEYDAVYEIVDEIRRGRAKVSLREAIAARVG